MPNGNNARRQRARRSVRQNGGSRNMGLGGGWNVPATFRTGLLGPTPCRGHVYQFSEVQILTDIVQTAAAETTGAITFRLSNLGNSASYSAIFDSYRIDKVEVMFTPEYQGNQLALDIVPQLFIAADFDDATAAGSAVLAQYANMRVTDSRTSTCITLSPAVLMGVLDSSPAVNASASRQMQWIDFANLNVDHYGVKYAMTAGAGGQTLLQKYHIIARYTFSCINQR